MSHLTLLAKITSVPGKEQAVFDELKAMVEPSRAEAGCMKYDLHTVPGDAATFWFVEEWRSREALEEHKETVHYKRLKERTKDIISQAELIELDPVS